MSKEIALLLTGAILPVGVWLCVLHYRFLHILQHHHSESWVALGKPKVIFSKTIIAETSISKFLFFRAYQSLQNPTLTMIGNDLRNAHILFLSLILGSLVFNLSV